MVLTALVGLLVGIGVMFVALRDDEEAPSAFDGPPSVTEIDRPAASTGEEPTGAEILQRADAATSTPAADPAVEPASPEAALDAFLAAEIADRSDVSFALLDGATQRRLGSVAAWRETRSDRLVPQRFTRTATKRNPAGAVEVSVTSIRRPEITPFRGLVAEESTDVFIVERPAGSGWRVQGGRPASSEPRLPTDDVAVAAAQSWVDGAARCDPAITGLQLEAQLIGPAALGTLPCRTKGTWRAGTAVPASDVPDVTAFVAAYGPSVGRWARGVEVAAAGGSPRLTVVLGPVGRDWRVLGLTSSGAGSP